MRGRLPIEISTRGAKFAEEADQSAGLNEKKIAELEWVSANLVEELRIVKFEIKRLKEAPPRDNTPPAVGSKG